MHLKPVGYKVIPDGKKYRLEYWYAYPDGLCEMAELGRYRSRRFAHALGRYFQFCERLGTWVYARI